MFARALLASMVMGLVPGCVQMPKKQLPIASRAPSSLDDSRRALHETSRQAGADFAQSSSVHLASFASSREQPDSNLKTIHVVGHGWHTGLVLSTKDVSPDVLPEIRDFRGTDFVEIGWGDEGFYRATSISIPLVLKAGFWPTRSVMHLGGFAGPVEEVFVASDIVELQVTGEQFDDLCRFVAKTFARSDTGKAEFLSQGRYGGNSAFYRARGMYYFPKTCNVWTAKAIAETGLSINAATAATADNVIKQSKKVGRVIQVADEGIKASALR
jgi:uncharacterized protein (TIGR02117 family)